MSNALTKGKAIAIFAMAMLLVVGVAVAVQSANAVALSDYGLKEGNTISAAGSSDPDVYIVNDWGFKRLFLNPAIFGLYGHLGGFASVKTVSPATRDAFPTSGLFRVDGTEKVYGLEATGEDTSVLHWVNTSGAQAVADDANFFKKVFVINQAEFNLYALGSNYTSVNQVPVYVRVGATPAPAGPVSASLASDNPASGTFVATQALADLAHFQISGSGTVTNVELKRLGVSGDTTLSAVYLFVNGARVSDSGNVSSGMITFSNGAGLFTAPAVLTVKSDILTGTQGQTVGVQLTKLNTTAVSVSGNLHTIAANPTLATVVLSAPTGPGDFNAGPDIAVWNSTLTVGNDEVYLKRLTLREIGSVNNTDITNLKLYVDGVQVATAAGLTSDGYVTFLTNTRLLQGGRSVKVTADVIGGSSRTMQFQIKGAYDLEVMDESYLVNVVSTPTTMNATPAASTIGAPTLTVVKASDSPSANVVNDAKSVKLAKYTMTGYGEAIKIESMRFYSTFATGGSSVDGLDNGKVFINGEQYGSTADLLITEGTGTVYTVNYTLQSGTPVTVEVYADIQDSTTDDVGDGDTILITFDASDNNYGQGVTSATSVDVPHTSTNVAGNTFSVAIGTMTAGKYSGYANQSVVVPRSGVKVGHFTLAAASTEDIKINTVDITGAIVVGSDFDEADVTDMYFKVFNDSGSLILTSSIKSTISSTASNSYSVNFTVPKSKTYQVEVWGNVGSTGADAADSFALEFDAIGLTVDSSTTVNVTRATGQTIAYNTSSLTKANGSLPAARFVNGSSTVTGYQFTLTPAYDDYTLEEVYVDLSSTLASSTGAVSTLQLKNSVGTVIGSATVSSVTASASFTGLNLLMTQATGTKTFSVDVVTSGVGVGANDTAGVVTVRLDGLKFRSGLGTVTTENGYVPASFTGNANNVVKGYPSFANSALSTSVLAAGSQTLFKTVVSATGGQVGWNEITFTVSSVSAAGTFGPDAAGWKLFENGVDITSFSGSSTASVSDIGTTTRVEFTFAVERVISAGSPVTLELKTTVGGTLATNDSVTTKITNPKGTTVTTDDSTVQRASGSSFTWTDQSAVAHATTTDDWFTDGMLKTLAESQTMTK